MTKNIARYGLLVALAFILSYIEFLIPISLAIPGIKLGITNIIIVLALILINSRAAISISIARVILVSFTFGNLSTMLYSLGGTLFSLTIMILFAKLKFTTVISLSMLGGVFHNIGQILVASLIVSSFNILYYLPVLILVGAITGIFVGIAVSMIGKKIPINFFNRKDII